MAAFDHFWELHDQALDFLNRFAKKEGPVTEAAPDEIELFEEFIEEFNDCITNRANDVDLEFIGRLVPLATAVICAAQRCVSEVTDGVNSLPAHQLLIFNTDTAHALGRLLVFCQDLLEEPDIYSTNWGNLVILLCASTAVDPYIVGLGVPLSAAPAPDSPALRGFMKLGVALRKLDCAITRVSVCKIFNEIEFGTHEAIAEQMSKLSSTFDAQVLVNTVAGISTAMATVLGDTHLELAEEQEFDLLEKLGTYSSAVSTAIGAIEGPLNIPGNFPSPPEALAPLLLPIAMSADKSSRGKTRSMACEVIGIMANLIQLYMEKQPGLYSDTVLDAGCAVELLRSVLPSAEDDDQLTAAIMLAILHLECVRATEQAKDIKPTLPFGVANYCNSIAAAATAWTSLMHLACEKKVAWHFSRSRVLTRAATDFSKALSSGATVLDNFAVDWMYAMQVWSRRNAGGTPTAKDTIAMLKMVNAVSVAGAASMALLERGEGEDDDTLLCVVACRLSQLGQTVASHLTLVVDGAGTSEEAWVAARATAHAAIKLGVVIMRLWDVLERSMVVEKKQLELALHAAAASVSAAMAVIPVDESPERQREVGALYAALFHLVIQTAERVGDYDYPVMDRNGTVIVFRKAVQALSERLTEVPLLGIEPAFHIIKLLARTVDDFSRSIDDCVRACWGINPKDEAQAVLLAQALSTLPCAHLDCASLPPAGELDLPRGKLCSGCRTARFCSSECSRRDWKAHKLACKALQRQREESEAGNS